MMWICKDCLNELYSRGEKFAILDHEYIDEWTDEDIPHACEWCEESEDVYELWLID